MDPIWNYAVLHPNSILPPVKEHTAEEKESLQYVDRFEVSCLDSTHPTI